MIYRTIGSPEMMDGVRCKIISEKDGICKVKIVDSDIEFTCKKEHLKPE